MRSAIIGLGVIGNVHASVLSEQGEEIVALCDVREDAALRAREKYAPNAKIYTDYQQMLDEAKPDVVHICTPHYLHAEMVIAALSRNVNTLCEKPLCIRYEDIDRILAAEAASTAILGVCHQNRYLASNLFAKDYLKDKKILGAHGSVVWHRDASYYASADWRGKWETEGGGSLINQALHTLDLLQWICGMPTHVLAHTANDHHKGQIEVEDLAAARFECADGTLFNFYATTSAGKSFPAHIRLRLSDKQTLHAENDLLTVNGALLQDKNRESGIGKSVWGNGHKALIADFYSCIEEDRPFPIDAEEGGKVIRLILSMYASNGERISIF